MTVFEALRLRRISEADCEIRKAVGRGVRLSGSLHERPVDSPFDEPPPVSLTLLCDESDCDGSAPQDNICFASRQGVCRLTNGHVVLGLLAGVPPPPENEPRLKALFESFSLARLSRSFLAGVAPVQSKAPTATATSTSTSTPPEVGLILVAERGDQSAFSRAWARPAFWRALMSNGHRLPVYGPLRCRHLIVDLPLVVATGALPASVAASLDVGDVVQFKKMRIQPDGTGHLTVGRQQVFYRFDAEHGSASLTIEAVHAPDRRRTPSLAEIHSMNVSHEFDEFEDDDDDVAAPGDQPTQEEADAEAITPSRDGIPHGQAPIDVLDIDVQVVVELGRLTVSIGELEDLKTGSVLKVSTPGVRRVTLKTVGSGDAGQTIAFGELVQVGDSLAVQITRVFE